MKQKILEWLSRQADLDYPGKEIYVKWLVQQYESKPFEFRRKNTVNEPRVINKVIRLKDEPDGQKKRRSISQPMG